LWEAEEDTPPEEVVVVNNKKYFVMDGRQDAFDNFHELDT